MHYAIFLKKIHCFHKEYTAFQSSKIIALLCTLTHHMGKHLCIPLLQAMEDACGDIAAILFMAGLAMQDNIFWPGKTLLVS